MTASNAASVPFAADSGSIALERMSRFQEPAARALIYCIDPITVFAIRTPA